MTPEYSDDGEPPNLAGAANDAVDWLALLAHMMDNGRLSAATRGEPAPVADGNGQSQEVHGGTKQ